jgi:hypothetical protein
MVINANFGDNYSYRDIAGYVIQAGLLPGRGLGTRFNVYLILESTIEARTPELPIFDPALDDDEPWREELKIATPDGALVEYKFPDIQVISYQTINSDRQQYHMIQFGSPQGLSPILGAEIPDIALKNDLDTHFQFDASQSKGTIAVNDTGAQSAQLLGFQALHRTRGAAGFQMLSERCKNGGWLQAILDQNRDKTAEGAQIDLKFMLNGKMYDCSPAAGADSLTGMIYEERAGAALEMSLQSIQEIVDQVASSSVTIKPPDFMESSAFPCRKLIDDWGGSSPENTYLDYGVEICSVISNTAEAREFDWRTVRQLSAF